MKKRPGWASVGVNKVLRVAGSQLLPDKAQIEGLLLERVFDDGAHAGVLEAVMEIAAEELVSHFAAASDGVQEVVTGVGARCKANPA